MLAEYFESPSRIQEIRGCPAGHLLEGFAQALYEVGYAQLTARRHLRSAEHLVHWTGRRGIPVTGLATLSNMLVEWPAMFTTEHLTSLQSLRNKRWVAAKAPDQWEGETVYIGGNIFDSIDCSEINQLAAEELHRPRCHQASDTTGFFL